MENGNSMKGINRKSWMKISNKDLCIEIIPKHVSSKKWSQNLKKKYWKDLNTILMQKKKKNCNDSNIYNKKLEIKEIYWENILTKFSKSNSYDHATIFNLCQ